MYKTSAKYILSGLLLLSTVSVWGVPADPRPKKILQPDGTYITIYVRGDEFNHVKTTEDGYPLVEDAKGYLTYAKTESQGNVVSTNIIAKDVQERSDSVKSFLKTLTTATSSTSRLSNVARTRSMAVSSSRPQRFPISGTPKSLVILVNFKDKSFVTSKPDSAFYKLLNEKGYSTNGGTGSARDYFRDNSSGLFVPTFDICGPYTLPNNMAYYGGNDSQGYDINPAQMIIDACSLADAAGIDFAQYDTDNDGIVDNVFVYYAGYNEAEGASANTVWPHRWSISDAGITAGITFDNKKIDDYACTSELRGTSGANMCGIGTFCHEFGHVLGLADFYNTKDETKYTLYTWDVMDTGPYLNSGRTPPAYSAYERYFLKWMTPTSLISSGAYSLDTLTSTNQAYLLSNNDTRASGVANDSSDPEYFLLENRQQKGWDAYLPGHGMLVTHIYYEASKWSANTPNNTTTAMDVDIVEADGVGSSTTLTADPFPGTKSVSTYSPTTRSGTSLDATLSNIGESNGKISFKFSNAVIKQSTSSMTFNATRGSSSASQTTTISAKKLSDDLSIALKNGTNYEIRKSGDSNWSKTITLSPTNRTVSSTVIEMRFSPSQINYPNALYDTLVCSSTGATSTKLLGIGWSKRPVYVTSPVATEATDSSTYSFTANWTAVSDSTNKAASGYYFSLYNIYNGTTTSDISDEWIDGSAYAPGVNLSKHLTNLYPDRDYYYKIKSSDKTSWYENISDYSNIIHIKTKKESSGKSMTVYYSSNGRVTALVPNSENPLYIYNSMGQLVKTLHPTDNVVEIDDLPGHQVYILKSGNKILKVIL